MTDSDSSSLIDKLTSAARSDPDSMTAEFSVHFWGVRGSVPTPGAETLRYGGNTTCVEVIAGGNRIIFDGGTGLRVLGKHLSQPPQAPVKAHLFFTHTHWDRIQGFPFFLPAFSDHNQLDIYGAAALTGASIKQCLTDQMLRPNFFTPLQKMRAQMRFHNIAAGSIISLENGVQVETVSLNPHTSALGFRVNWEGRALVYAADTAALPEQANQNLLQLAQQADLLIYDGTYSDHELNGSAPVPWESAVEQAKCAGVRQLVLFHHSPGHDDDFLTRMETEIQARFPHVKLAREGMTVHVA